MVTCRLPSLIKGHFSCHLTIGGLRSTAVTVTSSLRVCSLELKGTLVEDSKSYEGWSRHPDIILYLLVSLYVFKLFVHPVFLHTHPAKQKKLRFQKLSWNPSFKNCGSAFYARSLAATTAQHLATEHIHEGCLPGTGGAHDGLRVIGNHGMTFLGGGTFGKEVITFAN